MESTATLAGCVVADGAVGVQVIDGTMTVGGCAVSNMHALGNADKANSRFSAAANSQGQARVQRTVEGGGGGLSAWVMC